MKNEQRREKILEYLKNSKTPTNATFFANMFSVTRQIIVADIALLRASGYSIRAEHKGYILDRVDNDGIIKRIVVKHGKDSVQEELYSIVDNGGRVIDVIVEHSVYGTISCELNLSSRYDVDTFIEKINALGVNPLSLLTEGLHIHTIAIKDTVSFERIINCLTNMNILIEHD